MAYVVAPDPRGFILVQLNPWAFSAVRGGETKLTESRRLPLGARPITVMRGGNGCLSGHVHGCCGSRCGCRA